MDSFKLLSEKTSTKIRSLYVVHGDEDFLKREVMHRLRVLVLGEQPDEFSISTHAGDKAEYAQVMDDLSTVPFFGPRRLVIVENADSFVSRYRPALEKAVINLPPNNTLVLEAKTWPSNTRLAKLVPADATIVCKAPPSTQLSAWCINWAKAHHGKQLMHSGAELLIDFIGPDLGQLHQELEKLATYVGDQPRITEQDVDTLVGRSRTQDTWKIFDAISQGNAKAALGILHRLLEQGDDPMKILGAFRYQLQRIVQGYRKMQQGQSPAEAFAELGVQPFLVKGYSQQIKHLGAARIAKLYDWLLQINMDLRGGSPLPPRTLLERFIVRLANKE